MLQKVVLGLGCVAAAVALCGCQNGPRSTARPMAGAKPGTGWQNNPLAEQGKPSSPSPNWPNGPNPQGISNLAVPPPAPVGSPETANPAFRPIPSPNANPGFPAASSNKLATKSPTTDPFSPGQISPGQTSLGITTPDPIPPGLNANPGSPVSVRERSTAPPVSPGLPVPPSSAQPATPLTVPGPQEGDLQIPLPHN